MDSNEMESNGENLVPNDAESVTNVKMSGSSSSVMGPGDVIGSEVENSRTAERNEEKDVEKEETAGKRETQNVYTRSCDSVKDSSDLVCSKDQNIGTTKIKEEKDLKEGTVGKDDMENSHTQDEEKEETVGKDDMENSRTHSSVSENVSTSSSDDSDGEMYPWRPVTFFLETLNLPRLQLRFHNSHRRNLFEVVESRTFTAGCFEWRVLLVLRRPVGSSEMYLESQGLDHMSTNWSALYEMTLDIFCTTKKSDTSERCCRQYPLSSKYHRICLFEEKDSCIVKRLRLFLSLKKIKGLNYDSKKETGFVGLKNQGATCYMNSLLQMLYHLPYFRKSVYSIPIREDLPSQSIPQALQTLFYSIKNSRQSVSTVALTDSVRWCNVLEQEDIQEFNRRFCDELENKMKGTNVEGAIKRLFEGHVKTYIECISVDVKSTCKESFYDLQLDVKGCRDVYASLDKFVEVEKLEGENKYQTEVNGLQDAKKGILFVDLPPVLQLHLKRFEFNSVTGSMYKINDRYEYPLLLDLDRDGRKYFTSDADPDKRNLYSLYSVLVHDGGVHTGHYYAFLRPTLSGQWYKFDDDVVTKENVETVLEGHYGGKTESWEDNPDGNNLQLAFELLKTANAYMLIYIRDSDKEEIMCTMNHDDNRENLKRSVKRKRGNADSELDSGSEKARHLKERCSENDGEEYEASRES